MSSTRFSRMKSSNTYWAKSVKIVVMKNVVSPSDGNKFSASDIVVYAYKFYVFIRFAFHWNFRIIAQCTFLVYYVT